MRLQKSISFLLLLGFLITSFFVRLQWLPIRIWDEARNVNNALEMLRNGRWLVTYYDGAPDIWNTKPPLLIWMQVASMKIFGINEWAVRFPSAFCAMTTALVLWWFCSRELKNHWSGMLAGTVLASTFAYVYNHAGRTGDYDAPMVLFITCYSISIYLYLRYAETKWLLSFFAFLTLAVLTKGIAGMLVLPGILFYTLSLRKAVYILRQPVFYAGLALFILIIAGYYLLREHYNPGYLQAVYNNELGGRYNNTLEGHEHPFLYYFYNLANWRFPYWIYFIAPAFIIGYLSNSATVMRVSWFNFLMVLSFWLVISTAETKLEWYDLPLYPFISIQLGIFLFSIWRWARIFFTTLTPRIILASILFCITFYIPFRQCYEQVFSFEERPDDIEPHAQSYLLQDFIRQKKDLQNYVFCYEGYHAQINFYIEKLKFTNNLAQFSEDIPELYPGREVVVNQPSLEQKLLSMYQVKTVEKKYGCTVYLVLTRL
jgi:4-amino-4-deoxy-L-arabinose transferase-like glycosyltransferase